LEVARTIQAKKLKLESEIRLSYQQLMGIKSNIETRQDALYKEFIKLEPSFKKAAADLQAFEKISSRYI